MLDMSRNELIQRLERLDEDADLSFEADQRFGLVIVGGGALILQEYIPRATDDIDVLSVSPELLALLDKYNINCRVQAYVNNFPFNYEDRLVPLFHGRKIDFFAASLEDIVISKLYAMRPSDISDIEMDTVLSRLDWDRLEKLAYDENEAKASALNDRTYSNFLENYKEYTGRFRPCAN